MDAALTAAPAEAGASPADVRAACRRVPFDAAMREVGAPSDILGRSVACAIANRAHRSWAHLLCLQPEEALMLVSLCNKGFFYHMRTFAVLQPGGQLNSVTYYDPPR